MNFFDFLTKPLFATLAVTSAFCVSAAALFMPTAFPLQGLTAPAANMEQATVEVQTPTQAPSTPAIEHMPTAVPPVAPESIAPPSKPSDDAPVKPCVPCPTGTAPADETTLCSDETCTVPNPICPKCEPVMIGGKLHMICPEMMCAALN